LADKRVRKALWQALDREALKRTLRGTIALTADSYQHPFNPDYAPAAERIKFDPAAAAALLDEAGWHIGPDGVRINREGRRFHLNMVITGSFSLAIDKWLKEIGQRWSAIGVEFASTVSDNIPGRVNSTGPVQVWNTYMVQDNPRNYYHSSAIPSPSLDIGGFNYSNFADAEMDQAIEEFDVARCYPDRRRAAAQRINTLIAEKVPIIPLWFTSGSYLLPKSLDVGTVSGVDDRITARVEHWRPVGSRN
jgi:peptide/nickel transport system substrate-binding protein